jgi:fatty acid synthase, animal type
MPDQATDFGLAVQTGGKGVDLALNALADDKLHATVRCIAPNGSLLEIGKFDIIKVRTRNASS